MKNLIINNRVEVANEIRYKLSLMLILISVFNFSCKKFIEIDTLKDSLLSKQVFNNDAAANTAINGIYVNCKGLATQMSVLSSLASDDLQNILTSQLYVDYRNNDLKSTSSLPWTTLYSVIYACNSAIEGIEASKGLSASGRQQLIGEAKFIRAYAYFYLVNLFGDVPLLTATDIQISSYAPRTEATIIISQILSDLKDAKALLTVDYTYSGGDKIRANKWVASALLAKVYLFQKDYKNAEIEANSIIESGIFSLLDSPSGIFLKNNKEAILQWPYTPTESNSVASLFIFTTTPNIVCTEYLLNAFEAGDQRKAVWISSKIYQGKPYYFPYKFTSSSINTNEWNNVFRLAEQYFIRAESRAMQGKSLKVVIDDINLIRQKHGGLLIPLNTPATSDDALNIILHERQVDLFTEGMNRWLDLKRTGKLDARMMEEKPQTWMPRSSLYPIPLSDIQRNPNLIQNPNYQ